MNCRGNHVYFTVCVALTLLIHFIFKFHGYSGRLTQLVEHLHRNQEILGSKFHTRPLPTNSLGNLICMVSHWKLKVPLR